MAARRAAVAVPPAPPPEYELVQPATLHPGAVFQVLDTDGTWHAATVGAGVLCAANRRTARSSNTGEGFDPTTTVEWDYGVDRVDCTDPDCWSAVGRR